MRSVLINALGSCITHPDPVPTMRTDEKYPIVPEFVPVLLLGYVSQAVPLSPSIKTAANWPLEFKRRRCSPLTSTCDAITH